MIESGYFLNAIKRDIEMIRGDTLSFAFQVQGLKGQEPTKVQFSCKESLEDTTYLFDVSLADTIDIRSYDEASDTFTYVVRIPPEKTKRVEPGRYYYDLELYCNGDVITLMIGRIQIDYQVTGENSSSGFVVGSITINDNGTYYASDDGYDGYDEVIVNMPLGSKTIANNGTYTAAADNLKGFSSVTVNIPTSSTERLCYANYVGRDTPQIPVMDVLETSDNYSTFLSYDSSTGKFTVLEDFSGIMVTWVREYRAGGANSGGEFYYNDARIAYYNIPTGNLGDTAGYVLWRNFKAGDTFYNYTPSGAGYPQQQLKVYRITGVEFTDAQAAFSDET